MDRVDTSTAVASQPAQESPGTPGYFTKGNPSGGTPATVPGQDWFNSMQEEIIGAIEASGQTPDKAEQNQLTLGLPCDIAFMAGYGSDGAGEDVTVQVHGAVVLARAVRIFGEQMLAVTGPVDADLIVDVKKNGTSIYATLPEIADGATAGTAGDFTASAAYIDANAGDRIEFEVTQVGSTTAGQKLLFTLKAGAR